MEKENAVNSMFTVKKVLRILSFICLVMVFCPSFLVSCSGQDKEINVMTAVAGLSSGYGDYYVKPQPIMLICLIIPIVMLVFLFMKKRSEKQKATIIAAIGTVDLIMWFIFKSAAKSFAEKNYCEFKTTGWYFLNMIALLVIIVLAVMVVIQKLHMEDNLIELLSGGGTKKTLDKMSASMSQMSSAMSQLAGNVSNNLNNAKMKKKDVIGFCAKCGSPIEFGSEFCTSCGTPVPKRMIEEAKAARKEAEEAARKKAEEKARREAEEKARREAEEKAKREAEEQARKEELANQMAEEETKIIVDDKDLTEPSATDSVSAAQDGDMENQIWFCKKCGQKLYSGAEFCVVCGTKVEK